MRYAILGALLASQVYAVSPDRFESNNTMATATPMTVGTLSNLNIDVTGDADYFSFSLAAASNVTLSTSGVSGDSYLYLYDASGTLLASNDDYSGRWSQISGGYGAGDYYAKVTGYSSSLISDYSLTFAVGALQAPTRSGVMSDLSLSYGFSSAGSYSTYFTGATSYTVTSLKGIVKPRLSSSYLYIDSLYGKYGVDSLIIGASNLGGTVYDTIQVTVSAPTAPVRTYAMSDISLSNGFSAAGSYSTYFSGASSYTVTSLKGIVKPRMSGSYLYIDSLYGKYGTDSLIIAASNVVGTTYDTIQVTVSAPAAPVRTSMMSDLSFSYGFSTAGSYSAYFTGASSYTVSSLKGIVKPRMSGSYLYIDSLYGKYGVDSLIVAASNTVGTSYDTIQVTVNGPIVADAYEPNNSIATAATLVPGTLSNLSIHNAGNDYDYFVFQLASDANLTLSTSGVSGDTYLYLYDSVGNQLASNDDYLSNWSRITGNYASGKYYVRVNEYGVNDEIANYSLSLALTPLSAPLRTSSMFDVSIAYGFVSAGAYGTYFSSALSYTVTSLKGIVKPRMSGTYLYVDSLYGKYGTDSLVISASNSAGTVYDTIQFVVTAPAAPTRTYAMSDINLSYGFSTAGSYNTYFSGASSYAVSSLKGIVKPRMSGSYLYVDSLYGQYGTDSLIIAASNSVGTTYDTIRVVVAAPTAPTRTSAMSDLSYSYGFSTAGAYSTYFTGASSYTVTSLKAIVKPRMSGTYLYIDSLYGQYGTDSLIIAASNFVGTTYDTIRVVVAAPTAPTRNYTMSDINLSYGFISAGSYGTYFSGATSYAVSSLKGIVNPSMSGSYLYIDSLYGKYGTDSLIVAASNSVGTTYDTISVTVAAPPLPVVLTAPFADVLASKLSTDSKFSVGSHFSNATSYTVNVLRGSVCMDDDNYNDCYTNAFTLVASDSLWIQASVYDTVKLEIVGSNVSYSARDTMLYILSSQVPPALNTPLADLTLNYGFNSYGQSMSYTGATSYLASSLKGVVRPRISGTNLFIDSIAGKSGVDTVVVAASNAYGTTYDTLQVKVVNTALAVSQIASLPNLTLASQSDVQAINLDQYFGNATSYVIHGLSGQSCLDGVNPPSCLKNNFTLVGSTLYIAKTSLGTADVEITASNSNSSLRDTMQLALSNLTPVLKLGSLTWAREGRVLSFEGQGNLGLELYDSKGQKVDSKDLRIQGSAAYVLPVGSGVYFLRIRSEFGEKNQLITLP